MIKCNWFINSCQFIVMLLFLCTLHYMEQKFNRFNRKLLRRVDDSVNASDKLEK